MVAHNIEFVAGKRPLKTEYKGHSFVDTRRTIVVTLLAMSLPVHNANIFVVRAGEARFLPALP